MSDPTNKVPTSEGPLSGDHNTDDSKWRTSPVVLKFPTSGTSALTPEYEEVGTEAETLPLLPPEARLPALVRGKSLAQWGIERRQAAAALKEQWQKEIKPTIGSPAFAVRTSSFLDIANNLMIRYTGLPREEIFGGILQLIRDSLTGQNFVAIEQGRLSQPVLDALEMVERSTQLSLGSYDEILAKFIQAGFQPCSGQ